jgi:hypothetical protein
MVDVTSILAQLLARNRGPDPLNPDIARTPDYGIAGSLDGQTLSVMLTFRAGAAYCCEEWGCHLALTDRKRWIHLRQALAEHSVDAPPRLELCLSCVVEDGAMFFDPSRPDPARRGWYAFAPATAHQYQVSAVEAAGD